MRKYGQKSFIIKEVIEANSKEELNKLEIEIIRKFDTQKNGYNIDNGGFGSESVSDETKAKIGISTAKRWKDKSYREKVSSKIQETFNNPDLKKESSERSKANWENPILREKMLKNSTNNCESKKEKCRQATKERWTKLEYQEKMRDTSKENWSIDLQSKMTLAKKKYDLDPETRKQRMLKYYKGKTVIAILPNGTEQIIDWISDFCKQHNLQKIVVSDCLKGKRQSYKGYRFELR